MRQTLACTARTRLTPLLFRRAAQIRPQGGTGFQKRARDQNEWERECRALCKCMFTQVMRRPVMLVCDIHTLSLAQWFAFRYPNPKIHCHVKCIHICVHFAIVGIPLARMSFCAKSFIFAAQRDATASSCACGKTREHVVRTFPLFPCRLGANQFFSLHLSLSLVFLVFWLRFLQATEKRILYKFFHWLG